jgi:hypothetical protein
MSCEDVGRGVAGHCQSSDQHSRDPLNPKTKDTLMPDLGGINPKALDNELSTLPMQKPLATGLCLRYI